MKKYFLLAITIFSTSELLIPQESNYWLNATPGEIKIFSVLFTTDLDGKAISTDGNILITVDGGKNWINSNAASGINNQNPGELKWTADIYCSVMKTTDAGANWFPYEKEKQDHFCGVYLKDQNSGYNIASDFLNKVTAKIQEHFKNNRLELLIDRPQQCTEYFINADEGWALGWCVKNFKSLNNQKTD